ncbi:MAG: protein kinase [Legionellaceae bacterium]|nr:protein kinase [Legionellaceae bacterium]
MMKQASQLINSIHKNYLHRDIKHENFVWDKDNNTMYLCDFGLSCRLDNSVEKTVGSVQEYLAPEIIDNDDELDIMCTKQSDAYAFAMKTLTLI